MTEQMPGELIYGSTIHSSGTATSGRTEARTGSLAKPCLASEPTAAGRTRRSSSG
jgi:hypothetical protein